jgi:hypothetical protein
LVAEYQFTKDELTHKFVEQCSAMTEKLGQLNCTFAARSGHPAQSALSTTPEDQLSYHGAKV